ncbi:peptidase family M48-domain-containing protein [Cladochytrium replicatum]|nr:peptidase family M48-domain-containing protein [Cladochytrium replicatum]
MVFIGISGALGVYYFRHIEEVPISGRRRFIDVSPNVEQILARTAYSQIMQEFRGKILPPNHPYSRFVGRVAERIIRVAGMDDLKWEVHVIDSPQRNAFVLPGGKIFVFVGILPIVQNEDGMAAVLGHEVAHQVARHSAEKLSYTKGLLMLQFLLSLIIDPRIVFDQTISEYGILRPFSRIAETEADYIGLKLMATACFDPRAALTMWERMKLVDGDRVAPEYMSTHPGHDTRIKKIEQWLPEAIQIRANSNCQQVSQYAQTLGNIVHVDFD